MEVQRMRDKMEHSSIQDRQMEVRPGNIQNSLINGLGSAYYYGIVSRCI